MSSARCARAWTSWPPASRCQCRRAGDVYAVLDAGAYGYSESMPLFLSHPVPAEVVVDGSEVIVSRERLEPA